MRARARRPPGLRIRLRPGCGGNPATPVVRLLACSPLRSHVGAAIDRYRVGEIGASAVDEMIRE